MQCYSAHEGAEMNLRRLKVQETKSPEVLPRGLATQAVDPMPYPSHANHPQKHSQSGANTEQLMLLHNERKKSIKQTG